jgi:REP element-mobilizing transposase RayT
MTTLRQLLLPGVARTRLEHGGGTGSGKRKEERPFSRRTPLHVTFRSPHARGAWSLRKRANEVAVDEELERAARRFGVKIYERAVLAMHIHLLLRARTREGLQNFLRMVGGRIVQRVTGARKGRRNEEDFWDELAYSRVVSWGREFELVRRYIVHNLYETMGLIAFRPRGRKKKCAGAVDEVRLQ